MSNDLKTPLRIKAIYPDLGWWEFKDADKQPIELTQHRAEVCKAALEADAELGDPPCECCTKKGTEPYWHQECDCMNQGDLADAAGWCAEANLLGRKPNAEKEVQGG